jgi:ribonuclease VapC
MAAAPVVVLDSFALVAYFRDEPGAEHVQQLLQKAAERDKPLFMTEVSYAETKYTLLRKEGEKVWAACAEALDGLPILFVPADRRLADLAAEFKARFKLSLADAFSAALAKEKKAELVTGDPEFKALEKELKVVWLDN